MTAARAANVSRALVIATAATWGAWDLFAYLAFGRMATISHQLFTWSLGPTWFAPLVSALLIVAPVHFFGWPWQWKVFTR